LTGIFAAQSYSQEVANGSYQIQKNDTLNQIASRYDTSVDELVRLNKIANPRSIQPGQRLSVPKKYIDYTVKSGDTLSEIAKRHHVSTSELSQYNGIDQPQRLKIGQALKIPKSSGEAAKTVAVGPQLPTALKNKLGAIGVSQRWKYIVVHHSATTQGSLEGMDRYHREERHMENGLAYHFVIGNGRSMGDGEIGIGSRWRGQLNGGHLYAEWQNSVAIGICLVGNFEKSAPTAKQQESLVALMAYLQKRTGLSKKAIMPHRKINVRPTICPGKYFPTEKILSRLR
jgi:LysM repeat protein